MQVGQTTRMLNEVADLVEQGISQYIIIVGKNYIALGHLMPRMRQILEERGCTVRVRSEKSIEGMTVDQHAFTILFQSAANPELLGRTLKARKGALLVWDGSFEDMTEGLENVRSVTNANRIL